MCSGIYKDDYEKDLGVRFTNDLKPSLHCCKVATFDVNISKELFAFLHIYNICKIPSGILCTYPESLSCKRHLTFRESPEAGYIVSQRVRIITL